MAKETRNDRSIDYARWEMYVNEDTGVPMLVANFAGSALGDDQHLPDHREEAKYRAAVSFLQHRFKDLRLDAGHCRIGILGEANVRKFASYLMATDSEDNTKNRHILDVIPRQYKAMQLRLGDDFATRPDASRNRSGDRQGGFARK